MVEPARVLLAGDTHGNILHLEYIIEMARKFDADCIVVLGDFGYWEHRAEGIGFLKLLEDALAEADLELYWLDGNHENHPLLWWRYMGIVSEGTLAHKKVASISEYIDQAYAKKFELKPHSVEFNEWGFAKMRDHIYYIPRATKWEWSDVSFVAVGGAFSVDRGMRRVGQSFWFEEEITEENISDAIAQESCDIFLSHDVPSGVDLEDMFHKRGKSYLQSPPSEANRRKIRRIVDELKPSYVFHGHYHVAYSQELAIAFGNKVTRVQGLGCDEMRMDSFTIIDLKEGLPRI